MTHMMQLKRQASVATQSKKEPQAVCLSKLMEKSFLALKNHKARGAYVEAELVNGLAHQIRILRQQRGWTQKQLALKLATTPSTVSRLEDPSYGRYTIRSLLALGKVFDVALFVRYMPFSKFMPATWDTRPENFEALDYEEEVSSIQFFSETKNNVYESKVITGNAGGDYNSLNVIENTSINLLISDDNINIFFSNVANSEIYRIGEVK